MKQEVFAAIDSNRVDFEFLEASANCDYSASVVPLNVSLRMERNKRIWVSVNAVIFEAARILITEDSVHIVNYPENWTMSRPLSFMSQYVGTTLTVGQIQDLLIGNSIIIHDAGTTLEQVPDNTLLLMSRLKQYLFYEVINNENFRPTEIKGDEDPGTQEVKVRYDDFTEVNNRLMPRYVNLSALTNTQNFSATLKYTDISTEPISDFPFRIPPGYERK
ncbi:MAG TPA: DUF4292 domain-containing protein [Bacteroidia bacterium]|nr:DUF4292 domain-containing protein [Bacteroidia bacterium]